MERTLYRETKWLRFVITERKPKTVVVRVENTSGQFLGDIRWYGSWRQYTFNVFPQDERLTFNNGCLQDIADVLTRLNREHKEGLVKADGVYMLRDDTGYEITVEATFREGKLVRLVDKDGNNWIDWQRHVCWHEPRDAHA